MIGYSAINVFTAEEIKTWHRAKELIENLPHDNHIGFEVRCHELARAILQCLGNRHPGIQVRDGKFGIVDHSWIDWVRRGKQIILDVYSVASFPMVHLVDFDGSIGIRGARKYVEQEFRTDINENQVSELVAEMMSGI